MWERIENTQHSAWHVVNPQDVLALVLFRILLVPACVSSNSPTCFLRGRRRRQQWDAAIRQGNGDASSPILAPTTRPPGAACRGASSWFLSGRISPHPDSSLPFAYVSVISLASRFGSLCEGQEIKAVEWPENNRHSVAAAVPPQPAGPCRKRSAGGMGPQPLVPASIVHEGESAWTTVVAGGWRQRRAGGRRRRPSARWDAQRCSERHPAHSPVRGSKGNGLCKWKPQPPEPARFGRRLETRLLMGTVRTDRTLGFHEAFNW